MGVGLSHPVRGPIRKEILQPVNLSGRRTRPRPPWCGAARADSRCDTRDRARRRFRSDRARAPHSPWLPALHPRILRTGSFSSSALASPSAAPCLNSAFSFWLVRSQACSHLHRMSPLCRRRQPARLELNRSKSASPSRFSASLGLHLRRTKRVLPRYPSEAAGNAQSVLHRRLTEATERHTIPGDGWSMPRVRLGSRPRTG
jgi:hypothetical protein